MDTLTEQEKEDWVDATPSKGVFRYNNITKQVLRCLTIPAPHQGTVQGLVVIDDLKVADLVVYGAFISNQGRCELPRLIFMVLSKHLRNAG